MGLHPQKPLKFQAKAQPETETTVAPVAPLVPVVPEPPVAPVAPVAPGPPIPDAAVEAEATKVASESKESISLWIQRPPEKVLDPLNPARNTS